MLKFVNVQFLSFEQREVNRLSHRLVPGIVGVQVIA
jgi:hypothetical protein